MLREKPDGPTRIQDEGCRSRPACSQADICDPTREGERRQTLGMAGVGRAGSVTSTSSDEARGAMAIPHAELAVDVRAVRVDRLHADEEAAGDLLAAAAGHHQAEDFSFAA